MQSKPSLKRLVSSIEILKPTAQHTVTDGGEISENIFEAKQNLPLKSVLTHGIEANRY